MKRILIVCTGNVCRSPMAMGLLRQRLAQDGLDSQVSVSSAGVYGLDGSAASRPGVDVLAERGIDISEHRARTIDQKEVAEADLLLHIVDSASSARDDQIADVNKVLTEIGAADVRQLMVLNKIDLGGLPPAMERDEYGLSLIHI